MKFMFALSVVMLFITACANMQNRNPAAETAEDSETVDTKSLMFKDFSAGTKEYLRKN